MSWFGFFSSLGLCIYSFIIIWKLGTISLNIFSPVSSLEIPLTHILSNWNFSHTVHGCFVHFIFNGSFFFCVLFWLTSITMFSYFLALIFSVVIFNLLLVVHSVFLSLPFQRFFYFFYLTCLLFPLDFIHMEYSYNNFLNVALYSFYNLSFLSHVF